MTADEIQYTKDWWTALVQNPSVSSGANVLRITDAFLPCEEGNK